MQRIEEIKEENKLRKKLSSIGSLKLNMVMLKSLARKLSTYRGHLHMLR